MARSIPSDRLQRLIQAATQTFIAQGYRQTQMADVAEALGVAKGTLYGYVESKAALFDAVVRYADGDEPLPEVAELPLPTPPPGAMVERLERRIAARASDLTLIDAVASGPLGDVRSELHEVLGDLYRLMSANRFTLKLVDRCASEHPDLAAVWFGQGRWAQHQLLVQYLQTRIDAGYLRPVPSVPLAARFVLETVAFWAIHRHWDPSPQSIEEGSVEDVVVDLLVHSLIKE